MLEIQALSVRAGGKALVDAVSFTVAENHVLALYGPSGAGKSTTLHQIAGLTPRPLVAAGKILLRGEDLSLLPPEGRSRRGLAIVLQGLALFPHLTALSNVTYPLLRRGVPREEATARAREALARFQLAEVTERLPSSLSGGQQQRVALARATVTRPSVLLLDEPFKGLEQRLRDELTAVVRGMARTGTSVVLVTHEIRELQLAADSVVVMNQGRIVGRSRRSDGEPHAFSLPLTTPTIPSSTSARGYIDTAGVRLAFDLTRCGNGEHTRSVNIQEVRSLAGGGSLMALVEFEGGATRWIDVDPQDRSRILVGESCHVVFNPMEGV